MMAHAAAPRSENILKQGYLKRSLSSPDFLISASKQLAISLKQKFEPNRWYVFGTRDGHPYLEYFDREEKVFSGHPIDTIDLSTFRNLSYTLGRTNHKHAFCIFLGNRVLELTAPNRPQMLDWCRCLERNLRQLGYKNQNQREDHHYSEFPVNRYKPRRTSSPTQDFLPPGQQNMNSAGSEAAENTYEDVNELTSPKISDVGAEVPRVPPRPPKPRPHVNNEEEVFASLDSVTRSTNSSEGVYYMFEYSEEDQRLMEAYVTASETEPLVEIVEIDNTNSDLAEYDDADGVLLACQMEKDRDSDSSAHEDEAEERCTSLPILPARPSESDTSEDSDFVSASFWLRNRKEENLMSFNDSKTESNSSSRKLPPLAKSFASSSPPPPLPVRQDPRTDLRLRHCVSLYSDVNRKNKLVREKALDLEVVKPDLGTPPPLPKRLDIEEIKKQAEKDRQIVKSENSQKDDSQISLGKRFDAMNICLDPVENIEGKDDGTYESLEAPKRELNNNSIAFAERNSVENSIYGQVWDSKHSDSVSIKPKVEPCKQSKCPEKFLLKDSLPDKLTVDLTAVRAPATCASDRTVSENSANSVEGHENYYSDFPTKEESEKSGAFESNYKLQKSYSEDNSFSFTKSYSPHLSPILPKRKLPPKSNSSSDLKQIYSEVDDKYNFSGGAESNHVCGASEDIPVAPPRRHRKTVSGPGFETEKQRNAKSDPTSQNVAGLHSPPLPQKSYKASGRKMSEDIIDIPLPLPPRKTALRTQSVDDASPRGIGARPRSSNISTRQKITPHSGAVTVMNLKQTQADILRSEIASVGGMVRTISVEHFKSGLALVECFDKIWIAGWDVKKYPRLYDKFHIGDQVLSVNDVQVTDIAFTHKIVKHIKADYVELTIRRLPYANVYAIQRSMEGENLGLKREGGTGEIIYIDPHGLAYRHGLRNKATTVDGTNICNWYLTEINNRPLNLFFKDNEIQHRLLAVGRDISIVVQPCDFIQELKKQLKKLKSYKDFLVQ